MDRQDGSRVSNPRACASLYNFEQDHLLAFDRVVSPRLAMEEKKKLYKEYMGYRNRIVNILDGRSYSNVRAAHLMNGVSKFKVVGSCFLNNELFEMGEGVYYGKKYHDKYKKFSYTDYTNGDYILANDSVNEPTFTKGVLTQAGVQGGDLMVPGEFYVVNGYNNKETIVYCGCKGICESLDVGVVVMEDYPSYQIFTKYQDPSKESKNQCYYYGRYIFSKDNTRNATLEEIDKFGSVLLEFHYDLINAAAKNGTSLYRGLFSSIARKNGYDIPCEINLR